MIKMVMGIGIPGSGKTTFLKPFAEEHSYTYINPDDIRKEVLGDAINQSKNHEIWDIARQRVAAAFEEGKTVVFDATFAKDFERKAFIQFAREHGAEKVTGVFAEAPFEVANERNMSRERVVPLHSMKRMHGMLETDPPELTDGFDSIFSINEFQELERAEIKHGEDELTREFSPKPRIS